MLGPNYARGCLRIWASLTCLSLGRLRIADSGGNSEKKRTGMTAKINMKASAKRMDVIIAAPLIDECRPIIAILTIKNPCEGGRKINLYE